MPQNTLLIHPLYRAEDLGKPIPDTPHAISMCLPRWRDVVGYEERDPATMGNLCIGYPRFFYHPFVLKACGQFRGTSGESIQIYSTRAAAERGRAYLRSKHPDAELDVRGIEGHPATILSFPEACAEDAKAFWQHAGEGISSRCAERLLNRKPVPDATAARRDILARLAEYTGVAAENIYLFPSGMAAIFAALRFVQSLYSDRPTVQFAFPYGDTLKLQQKMGNEGTLFYPRGGTDDLAALKRLLGSAPVAGLFCEFPTNPLLSCVDLSKLRALADAHQFPIIIDETLGACINQNTLALSDASVISLTKFFSGTSDVMGGALVVNPSAPFADDFAQWLKTNHEPEACHPADLIELARASAGCRERVEQINKTAMAVCGFLARHPAVENIFYPAFTDREMYDRVKRPGGGYGGLFSFVLKDAARYTETFYDALEITKGPNLGTTFSLCCPFTLIAHYNELEWAEAAGASRYLIRISVGLEPAEDLIARLGRALDAARS